MGDGISTVALSVSTSSSGASSAMTSPSRTSTFTISASVRPSPRSGNLKSRAMGIFTEPEERHGFPGRSERWGAPHGRAQSRGAARLRRDAPNVGGYGGDAGAPILVRERVAGGGDHA